MIFDDTVCVLGEGVFWHPTRGSLFWFDIHNKFMFERTPGDKTARVFKFDEHISAMGWIDGSTLLIASETALLTFNLEKRERNYVIGLESDNFATRSNDGRADPLGGFWIGTMGKHAQPNAGAIYRYFRGELRKLYSGITIANSICFSPDGKLVYYCDTPTKRIMKQRLDDEGWPDGNAELFADVAPYHPDGSVVDIEGNLWNAQWGSHRVACYDSQGCFVDEITFPASQISCPAFGGKNFDQLFVTSAIENLTKLGKDDGKTFVVSNGMKGQREHQIKL